MDINDAIIIAFIVLSVYFVYKYYITFTEGVAEKCINDLIKIHGYSGTIKGNVIKSVLMHEYNYTHKVDNYKRMKRRFDALDRIYPNDLDLEQDVDFNQYVRNKPVLKINRRR